MRICIYLSTDSAVDERLNYLLDRKQFSLVVSGLLDQLLLSHDWLVKANNIARDARDARAARGVPRRAPRAVVPAATQATSDTSDPEHRKSISQPATTVIQKPVHLEITHPALTPRLASAPVVATVTPAHASNDRPSGDDHYLVESADEFLALVDKLSN